MTSPRFGVCSKCWNCGQEFTVTLDGGPLSFETYEQADAAATRLKEYVADPKGLRQILDAAMYDSPQPLGRNTFEHFTCQKCQTVLERASLPYWVIEV